MKNFLLLLLALLPLHTEAALRNLPADTVQFSLLNSAPTSPTAATVFGYFRNDGFPYWRKSDGSVLGFLYSSAVLPSDSILTGGGTREPSSILASSESVVLGHSVGAPTFGLIADTHVSPTAAIANSKMADMAQSTIKGRQAGAGTGAPQDLTSAQATAILDAFVGDSGSGGTKGMVPAPASGDATKCLLGDGTWGSCGGGGGGGGGFPADDDDFIFVEGGNGHGSTNTKIRRYLRVKEQAGALITYADSSTNGGSFTIATGGAGGYLACSGDFSSGSGKAGVTVNASAMTTSVANPLTYAQGLRSYSSTVANGTSVHSCIPLLLADGDVVRTQTTGAEDGTDQRVWFALTRVGSASDFFYANSGNGHGSTYNKIRRYSNIQDAAEASITFNQSSTDGDSVTFNTAGTYIVCGGDSGSSGGSWGMTLNETLASTGSTSIGSLDYSQGLRVFHSNAGNSSVVGCFPYYFAQNDVLRVHTSGAVDNTDARSYLAILKVGTASKNHIYLQGHGGHGSVNTKYKYFTATQSETASSGAYLSKSTVAGDQYYVNDPGIYMACYSDSTAGASCDTGLVVDGKLPTTTILSQNHGSGAYSIDDHGTANEASNTCFVKYLYHGQIVSPTDDGGTNAADNDATYFMITRFL